MNALISGLRALDWLTVIVATMLSVGTIWMFVELNNELTISQELFDDNLPSYTLKAEYELARLESELSKFMLGTSSRDDIQLRYDIFFARLNHYESSFFYESDIVFEKHQTEIHIQTSRLMELMLSIEKPFFDLREDEHSDALDIQVVIQSMYKPLEELTTIGRDLYNKRLESLDNGLARGIRVGFLLILFTVLTGALTVALFWFNLKEKTRFSANLEKQIQARTKDLQISNVNLKEEIDERQRAERTLAVREQQIHRVQKMEAVGRVTSGVAHDFNNLLAVIMGNIELLQGSNSKSLSEKYLDNALAATVKGSQLTRKLLAFGKRSPLKLETVDINQVILEIDDLFMHTLPENISLDMSLADGVWPISVDRSLLENVLLNLVINARDALNDSGCIIVKTNNVSNLKNLSLNNANDHSVADFVSVSISDEGSGMTVQVLDQVFEPFFSTKTESEGSGLGLSMASGFVQQSKGSIKVTSAPGKGTTVLLLFPRCFSEVEAKQSKNVNQLQNSGKARKVLVVEDLEAVRKVVVEQLNMLGYESIEATNGTEAFDWIRTDISIDLMISDVVMPGPLQGLELAKRAKHIRPELKIIIMSGYPKGSLHDVVEPGDSFTKLMKPVRLAALSNALRDEFKDGINDLAVMDSVY